MFPSRCNYYLRAQLDVDLVDAQQSLAARQPTGKEGVDELTLRHTI